MLEPAHRPDDCEGQAEARSASPRPPGKVRKPLSQDQALDSAQAGSGQGTRQHDCPADCIARRVGLVSAPLRSPQ